MTEEIVIDRKAYETIRQHALETYPHECCGLLFKHRESILDAEPVKNVVRPGGAAEHYHMDPMEVYAIEERKELEGLNTAGVFHSHPNKPAILSEKDDRLMIPGLVYVILSVKDRELKDIKAYIKPAAEMKARRLEIRSTD